MKFDFIDAQKAHFPVDFMCQQLGFFSTLKQELVYVSPVDFELAALPQKLAS